MLTYFQMTSMITNAAIGATATSEAIVPRMSEKMKIAMETESATASVDDVTMTKATMTRLTAENATSPSDWRSRRRGDFDEQSLRNAIICCRYCGIPRGMCLCSWSRRDRRKLEEHDETKDATG